MPRKRIPAIRLDEAIESFFKELNPEKMAKTTHANKKRTLLALQDAAGGPRVLTRNLQLEHFRDTLTELAATRSVSSLKIDRICLKQFADFCKHNGWVRYFFDPMYRITRSNKDNPEEEENLRQRRNVPHGDWPKLLDAAEHPRDRMILAVGLHWGTRASTTTAIKLKHFDLSEGAEGEVALLNVKKGRRYVGPIGAEMLPELHRYLDWYQANYGELQPNWYLTPSKQSGREALGRMWSGDWPLMPDRQMSPRLVWTVVKDALRSIGWTEDQLIGEGGHTLRRSAAIWTNECGGTEASMVQLDHESEKTNRHYTGNRAGRQTLAKIKTAPAPREPEPEPTPTPEVEPEPEPQLARVFNLADYRRVG